MIPIMIVPRYGCIVNTVQYLKKIACSFESEDIEEHDHVTAISANIEKSELGKLSKLKDYVDLIVVYNLTETVLDKEYKSLSSDKFDIEEKFVFYSPTAKRHEGKMSRPSKSDATYSWIIFRDEEPADGRVALLLQHLKPNAKTSHHHHMNTLEFFLPLAGKTILRQQLEKGKPLEEQNLKNACFTKVVQEIPHQLRTTNGTALNCLCMKPYDPDLKDHYYSA